MNIYRLVVVFGVMIGLSACGSPAATTPTAAPTSVPVAAATVEATAAQPTAEATAAAMDMGGIAETYGPSIAAGLPAVQLDLSAFPVTIENCGRSLTFTKPPERVASLWQPPNELLLALGVQDRIIALAGNYTTLPEDLAASSKNIKQIGFSMAWPAKEVLLSETPDLVVAEGLEGFSYDASKGYATVAEIEATGAKVLSTGGSCTPSDPGSQRKSTQTVFDDLTMLGKVFGVSARADTLIAKLKAKEAAVIANVAAKPPVKVAFYNGGEGPLFVLSFGIWADLMKKAGGEDVLASALPAGSFEISAEAFAAGQPDVILIGYYPGQDPKASIEFLKKTFPTIPAVQDNRLVPVPTIETEATVQVMDGLEKIARGLHPEAFTTTAGEPTSAPANTTSGFPLTIENCGQTLTFTKPPERTITTFQSVTEILVALGVSERIVGSQYSQIGSPPPAIAEDYARVPVLAADDYASKEAIIAAKPDLYLAAFHYDFGSPTQLTREELGAAGAQVYLMSDECTAETTKQASIGGVYQDIRNLEQIFGVAARAEQLVAEIQTKIAAVQQRVAGQSPVKTVYYISGKGPVNILGGRLYSEFLSAAGGENIFGAEIAEPKVSVEAIADAQPEAFIITDFYKGTHIADDTAFLQATFLNTPAIRANRIDVIGGDYFTANIRMGDTVELLARALHPEAFK